MTKLALNPNIIAGLLWRSTGLEKWCSSTVISSGHSAEKVRLLRYLPQTLPLLSGFLHSKILPLVPSKEHTKEYQCIHRVYDNCNMSLSSILWHHWHVAEKHRKAWTNMLYCTTALLIMTGICLIAHSTLFSRYFYYTRDILLVRSVCIGVGHS